MNEWNQVWQKFQSSNFIPYQTGIDNTSPNVYVKHKSKHITHRSSCGCVWKSSKYRGKLSFL